MGRGKTNSGEPNFTTGGGVDDFEKSLSEFMTTDARSGAEPRVFSTEAESSRHAGSSPRLTSQTN